MIRTSPEGMHIVLYLVMADANVQLQYVKSNCVLGVEEGRGYIHAYLYDQRYFKCQFDTISHTMHMRNCAESKSFCNFLKSRNTHVTVFPVF